MTKRVLIWLLAYFVIQIIFAGVYYGVWVSNPCSFLFADDINENPIGIIRSIMIEDEQPKIVIKKDVPALTQLTIKISTLFNQMTQKQLQQNMLQKDLEDLSTDITQAVEQNEAFRGKRIDDYKEKELKTLREAVSEKKQTLEYIKKSYQYDPERWKPMDIIVANEQVELSNKQLELSKKTLEAQKYIIKNYGAFADPKLMHTMRVLEDKRESYVDERMILNNEIGELRGDLNNIWRESYKIRVSKLNFLDFIYFSLITATTTGYGDITPNNRIIRFVVIFQIVISLIIFALFIDNIVKHYRKI